MQRGWSRSRLHTSSDAAIAQLARCRVCEERLRSAACRAAQFLRRSERDVSAEDAQGLLRGAEACSAADGLASVASSFNDEVALATSGIDARATTNSPAVARGRRGALRRAAAARRGGGARRLLRRRRVGRRRAAPGSAECAAGACRRAGAGARTGTRTGTRTRAGARAGAGTRGDLGGDARRLVQAVRRPGGAANSRGGVRARRRDGRRHGARHDVRSDAAGRPAAAAREAQPDAHAAGAPRRAAGRGGDARHAARQARGRRRGQGRRGGGGRRSGGQLGAPRRRF